MVFKSKPGAYSKQRFIVKGNKYDNTSILYNEGVALGNRIFFDTRNYVMPVSEFTENFEPIESEAAKQ